MGSLFKAHIFKERTRGPREEVKIKLFNLDDSPFELPEVSDTPTTPEVEDWIVIPNSSMMNGWTSLGAGYAVRYRKRPDGIVEMRGYIKPGPASEGQIAFILPEGYRPIGMLDDGLIYPIVGYDSGASRPDRFPPCVMTINPNGETYIQDFTVGSYYIHICNVRFPTD
jgi:hypothetical protein